jgi:hypothetical protein
MTKDLEFDFVTNVKDKEKEIEENNGESTFKSSLNLPLISTRKSLS